MSEARLFARRAVADAEGKGRTGPIVLEEFLEADADDIAETMLAIVDELAEPDAEYGPNPRVIVLRDPVGADSVMYAIEETFVVAST